jgi:hypothetical protein
MIPHDYLVLGIAALWLVTGALGLGFTIARLRHRAEQRQPTKATAAWH